ncbi:MAG: tetratricopeptide repeat protein [Pirellulales bacterium]
MKRLNVKLTLWLVGIVLVSVVGVHLLHGFQLERNADFLKLQAESAEKAGDSEEAISYYNQYLKYKDDPEGYSALAKLVDTRAQLADAGRREKLRAYSILEEAIRRHPDLADVRRRLIEYTIMMRRFPDALEHIRLLRDPNKTDAELDLMTARCYFANGEEDRAVDGLYQLVGFDKASGTFSKEPPVGAKEVEAFELLAHILRRKPDMVDRAHAVMEQLVAYNPDSADAHLARARFISASADAQAKADDPKHQQDIGDIKASLDKAINLAPDDPDVVVSTAVFAITEKQYDKARELLTKAAEKFPERQEVYLCQAQLSIAERKHEEGIAHLKIGAEKAKDVQMILPMLFDMQIEVRDLTGAAATCDAMQKRETFLTEFVRFSRARLQFAEGNFWESMRELEAVRPAIARSNYAGQYLQRLELILGGCYESLGLYDRQLEVARRILQSDPRQAGARLSEAFALQRLGRFAEAETDLQLLFGNVEQYPELRGPVYQLLLADQMRRPKEQRNWTHVEKLAEELLADPSRTEMDNAVLKGELLMSQEKLDEALAVLTAARRKDAKDQRVWSSLAKLLGRMNREDRIAPLLDMAEKEAGSSFALRTERARLIARTGGENAAAELQKVEQGIDTLKEPERVALMSQLGGAYLQLRDFDNAKRCWKYVVEHDAKNAQLRQLLFELMSDTQDFAGMEAVLKDISQSPNWGPQSPLYKYCKAMSLIRPMTARGLEAVKQPSDADRKALTDARRLVAEALTQRNEWGSLWRVRGELDQLEGDLEGAVVSYQRAMECSHTGQTAVARRLVRLLSTMKRYEEADKMLQYVGELSATDPLNKMVQMNKVEKGDVVEALAMAQKDVQEDPQNPANHIWLAHVLEQSGRTAEAEAEFRKAAEVGPKLPQAWIVLVRHLVANKKTAEAAEVIRQAQPHFAKNLSIMAQLHEIVSDRQQAEQLYQAAIEANPEDLAALQQISEHYIKLARSGPREQTLATIRQATPYLEKIVAKTADAKEPAKINLLGWARRTQAEILAASGSYEDVVNATKLIEQNRQGGRLPPADIQAVVDMLANRPEPESRAKSIQLIEQLGQQRALQPREQLLLGQLYDRQGNWARAKELMVSSLTAQGNDPETMLAFVASLMQHGEKDDASRWLDTLDELLTKVPPRMNEKVKPHALELRARLLVQQGQPEKAVAVLMQLVPSPLPPNELFRLEQVSMLMEQLGQFDAARRLLDDYVGQEPRGKIALAAFLGRRGEVDKAFALLDESRGDQSLTDILPVALEGLRRYPKEATPERFKTLEGWVSTGLSTERDPQQVKLILAEAYDLQGRYDDVVKIYREVLAAPETTPRQAAIVKNNLAFVLAVTKQDLPEALKLIGESINVMGPISDLLDTRGLVYLHQGDVKQAVADLRLSASNQPTVSKYFHLAQAEKEANNLDAARTAIAQAEQMGADLSRMTPLEQKSYRQLVDELK